MSAKLVPLSALRRRLLYLRIAESELRLRDRAEMRNGWLDSARGGDSPWAREQEATKAASERERCIAVADAESSKPVPLDADQVVAKLEEQLSTLKADRERRGLRR